MSDEAEELNLEGEPEPAPELEPTPELEPAPEPAAKPAPRGYQSREEWAESGKDPKDYVSEEVYEAKGSLLKEINKLTKRIDSQAADYEGRLTTQNKLHTIALNNRISDLETQRDAAVEEADAPEVARLQGQIDDNRDVAKSLEDMPAPAAAEPVYEKAPEQAAWESKNAWIMDKNDPRSSHAKSLFNQIKTSGEVSNYQDLFNKLDIEMARAFPEENQARNRHRSAEGGSPSGKPKAAAISSRDLSSDDVKYFVEHGNDVVPGKDNVTIGGKTIRGVDKAKMYAMIEESRAD